MRRFVLVVAVALAAASCNGAEGESRTRTAPSATEPGRPPSAAKPGTYAVCELTETFVDTSRPTTAAGGQGRAPTRTRVTVIGDPRVDGPFPLVLLAHDQTGQPSLFRRLT